MQRRLSQIQDWPERARAAQWSATVLARHCGVSRRTLHRFFRRHMRQSPKAWLAAQRLRDAHERVRTEASIKEAAARLGYQHQTNFTRRYKSLTGICPSLLPPAAPPRPPLSPND